MEQKFEIPAESFKSALEAAQNAGEPILGATVSLQLKQAGMETIPVSLQVDENLLFHLAEIIDFHPFAMKLGWFPCWPASATNSVWPPE